MIFRRLTQTQSQGWMLTLADLLALLLTFFVLLVAMRTPEVPDGGGAPPALDQWLNPEHSARPGIGSRAPLALKPSAQAQSLSYWKSMLEHKLQQAKAQSVTLQLSEEGLRISLPGDVFFAPGEAVVHRQEQPTLALLAQALETIGKPLALQGHTDPSPIATAAFPSNWELSLARAQSIADALRNRGFTRPITIQGYGEGQFPPDMVGQKDKRHYTTARRVDMLLVAGE